MNSVLDAALAYVARGWPVHPLKPRSKEPATEHGFKDATTDEKQIRAWYEGKPDLNVGIQMGVIADAFALDVDPKHEGEKTLAALVAKHGSLPKTITCRTGTGGTHHYFRLGNHKVGNKIGFLPGLDLRGEGGYVVTPPSVHPNGEAYKWEEGRAPGETAVADAPAWLIEAILGKPKPKSASKQRASPSERLRSRADAYVAGVPNVGEGQRNATAFKLAGSLRALETEGPHLSEDVILDYVLAWNAGCTPPLAESEVEQCVRSSATNGTPPATKPDARAAPRRTQASQPGRLTFLLRPSERHDAVAACLGIFAAEKPPSVFNWNGNFARIVRLPSRHRTQTRRFVARPHVLNDSAICDTLNHHVQFLVERKNKSSGETVVVPIDCPLVLARWLLSRGGFECIAQLNGILEAPTMLADGRVLLTPGYDSDSGLFLDFAQGDFPPIPASPTKSDALAALNYIADIFSEFPFEKPAHRSVVYSAALSSVARPAFHFVPMHSISAPVMETGKTLLADCLATIATGDTVPAMSQALSEEESEKRVQSVLLDGRRIALIDNVTRPLGGEALCTAITSDAVAIRRFRTQEFTSVPTTGLIWLATGNNLTFDKDMRSRALMARLDPRTERPGRRTFKIEDLRAHLRRERHHVVVALLTILRAFVVAGRPGMGLKPLNRFEGWSALVRAALVWLDQADPVETMDAISRSDAETQALSAILHGLYDEFGLAEFTSGEALRVETLREALAPVCRGRDGQTLDPVRLGRFFEKSAQRVVEGLRLELAGSAKGKNRYRISVIDDDISGWGGGGGGGCTAAHDTVSPPHSTTNNSDPDPLTRTEEQPQPPHHPQPEDLSGKQPMGVDIDTSRTDEPFDAGLARELMADAAAHAESMKVEGKDDDPDAAEVWNKTFDNKPVWS